ncbi:MAG: beta-galactosidase, partial [Victivallales bacterium]|nr:beta-galactosidase [Victivallales bacterium]
MMKENDLIVDGRPFLMRGAEIHYFRTPREKWETLLRRASDSGINTITACVPWFFHEYEEGKFDFDGSTVPERDIRGFITEVAAAGLKFVAHPGPFLNCEFRAGGIPEWLFKNYPETLSRRADGQIAPGRPIPAEGEPLYREFVKKWFAKIVPIFAENQVDSGGPVILFQPDNELSAAWSYGLLNSLYDPTVLNEFWPKWLQGEFADIADLNQIAGTEFRDYREVPAPRSFPSTATEKTLAHLWMEFKRWFLADWGATMAEWGTEFGMRTPVIFNEPVAGFYGHGDHSGFGSVMKERGFNGATVCHSYSPKIMDLEGLFNPISGIEMIKASPWGGPPMSVEINCSWNIPRLSMSAMNWNPLLRALLGRGLKGYSIFTFAEATANLADSIDGPGYFEGTCLNIDGESSIAGTYLERFNAVLETWEDVILGAKASVDAILAFSPASKTVDFIGAEPCLEGDTKENTDSASTAAPGGDAFDAEPALDAGGASAGHDWLDGYENVSKQTVPAESGVWSKFKEAFLLLNRANLSCDFLDMAHPNKRPGFDVPLIVPCTGTLEKESIDFLVDHLNGGGKALFSPTIPMFTTDGMKDDRVASILNRLSSELNGCSIPSEQCLSQRNQTCATKSRNFKLLETIPPAGGELFDYGARVVEAVHGGEMTTRGWIFDHDFPENADPIAAFNGKTVVAKIANVVVSGVNFQYSTTSTLDFWQKTLSEFLAISPSVKTSGNYAYASLLNSP